MLKAMGVSALYVERKGVNRNFKEEQWLNHAPNGPSADEMCKATQQELLTHPEILETKVEQYLKSRGHAVVYTVPYK